MTLTTFSDVEWNRPLYEHLGFTVVPDEELSPGLLAIRDHERERGLEPPPRVCMRKQYWAQPNSIWLNSASL